jgi:hypothetical protein
MLSRNIYCVVLPEAIGVDKFGTCDLLPLFRKFKKSNLSAFHPESVEVYIHRNNQYFIS